MFVKDVALEAMPSSIFVNDDDDDDVLLWPASAIYTIMAGHTVTMRQRGSAA